MLKLQTEGISGNGISREKVKALVNLKIDGEIEIIADDFEGNGKSYKRRDTALIRIYSKSGMVFEGTANELLTQLS